MQAVIALTILIVAWALLAWWLLRTPKPRGYSRPVETVLANPKPPPAQYDDEGEPIGTGPSPELLARMEAAGMNTTHEKWDDFEAERNRKEARYLRELDEENDDDR